MVPTQTKFSSLAMSFKPIQVSDDISAVTAESCNDLMMISHLFVRMLTFVIGHVVQTNLRNVEFSFN